MQNYYFFCYCNADSLILWEMRKTLREKLTGKLLLLAFLFALPAMAGDANEAIRLFTESPAVNAEKCAVKIVDLRNGRTLGEHNASLPLVPASIMKNISTATLLDETGPHFRYETPVYIAGRVKDGTVEGNLIVRGSGDPTINSRHEPASANLLHEIRDALKARGINRITGRIIVDEDLYEGPPVNPLWAAGDLSQSYGTGSHAFNFEDNASGKASVKDPANVFRTRLASTLAAAGITLEGAEIDTPRHRTLLITHKSAPADEIMRSCIMRSDNQFAEAILRTFGKHTGGDGSTSEAAEKETAKWKKRKAPMEGVRIVDGSGLSRSNRMTADFMAFVLRKMSGNPHYASFFPLAGQEGTLKRLLSGTSLDSYIAMKTGSMNGIQCYAGYKLDDNYAPTHAVVIMVNGLSNRAAMRAEVEKMLLSIFDGN